MLSSVDENEREETKLINDAREGETVKKLMSRNYVDKVCIPGVLKNKSAVHSC